MSVDHLYVIDSHTEGEPTRVVVDGFPALAALSMRGRRTEIERKWDHLRTAMLSEPRGSEAMVAAILTPPVTAGAAAGVVFCNDAGYLDMCGHGAIGVVRTLHHLGTVAIGRTVLDTPAGTIRAQLHDDGSVTIENVASRCIAQDVTLDVPGIGHVVGDVAYGGNWFFLTQVAQPPLSVEMIPELMAATTAIRTALVAAGVRGDDGGPVDHIELFAAPLRADADSRNFVRCPGAAYDRSPCGTGTSAKMATLFARGKLGLGQAWRQESIIGSRFVGRLHERDGQLIPSITGSAHVIAEAHLRFGEDDPYRYGLFSRT
jgi:4-hydroxyproline epimerase